MIKPAEKELLGDTKERILKAATELFAEKGFEGTGMRDIAQIAQVNLASINYHFENKSNLFMSVFERNFHWLESGIESIAKSGELTTKELAYEIHKFFMKNASELLNFFRIFLGSKLEVNAENLDFCQSKDGNFGPPGGVYFFQALKRDLPQVTKDLPLMWGVSAIFTHLIHSVILRNCSFIQEHCARRSPGNPMLQPEFEEHNVHALVEAVENFIIANPNYWDDLI